MDISEIDKEFEEEFYCDDSLYNLISYGADLSVRELTTMFEEGEMIKPSLQRNFVWSKSEAGRFIDSILLGLPVPSIFLAKDTDGKLLIVDGLQRITTLVDFQNGRFSPDDTKFRLPKTDSINERWRGLDFSELPPELQRRIKCYTIHAIMFDRKDNRGNDTAMYQIFERINTGGRILSPQEIRNCVYHGTLNDLIIELNNDSDWRHLLGSNEPDKRMKDVEIILRCFGIKEIVENDVTKGNFSKYLNEFMGRNRNINTIEQQIFTNYFKSAVRIVNEKFLNSDVEGRLQDSNTKPILLIEALIVNLFLLMDKKKCFDIEVPIINKIEDLLDDEDFKTASSARTTNITNIRTRIKRCAVIIFGENHEADL